jgi:hypothetical protein
MRSRSAGRVGGCDPEAAVALDDRRDAVPRRRREVGIPEHLGVEVGVHVDEAGCQHEPTEVDVAVAHAAGNIANRDDAAVAHLHVGSATRPARPVDDRCTPQDDVFHVLPLVSGRPLGGPLARSRSF